MTAEMLTSVDSMRQVKPETHEQWLQIRSEHVTATEVASAFVRRTAANWAEIRDRKQGARKFAGNACTRWGHERESEIFDYAQAFIYPDLVLNEDPQTIWVAGRFSATPDSFAPDLKRGCEFKTTSRPLVEKPQLRDQYLAQVQFTMWLAGAKEWALVVEQHDEFQPVELSHEMVAPDVELQHQLAETATDLYRFCFHGIRPAWMGGVGDSLEEVDALADAVQRLGEVEEQQKALGAEAKDLKATITSLCGESASEELGGWKLTVSTRKPSTRFNAAAFKKEHPDLHAEYMTSTVSGSTTVKVTRIEEEAA
ncbi:YqaJ viral recombinase family protein [Corynebacterium renale]|uniref:YqaJ viral recombinase family protein n=1 Tax=Corynebacterium renale TaxID=1724 RepID=UPI000E051578|nr:YqaJ viral recombinase family protein [Corynebacterium renale]STC97678.1 YqaJ-like viral recombinase domain [Corynebacterium renale]